MKPTFVALLFVFSAASLAQAPAAVVTVHAETDGVSLPPTSISFISFSGGGDFARVPVIQGKFEVPRFVSGLEHVDLETDIVREKLTVKGLSVAKFESGTVTIFIASKRYDNNQIVPKGANISRSCILSFDPGTGDGTEVFVPNCRKKRK